MNFSMPINYVNKNRENTWFESNMPRRVSVSWLPFWARSPSRTRSTATEP